MDAASDHLATGEHGYTRINLNSAVGEEYSGSSAGYGAFVGADLSAHNLLLVRMNSHLQNRQLRNLG
jgi:hypothetical protein